MRKLLPAIFSLAVLPASAADFEDRIDRFTGDRQITWDRLGKPVPMTVSIAAIVPAGGASADAPGSISIHVASQNGKYLKCHSVHWLADGQPVSPVRRQHDAATAK